MEKSFSQKFVSYTIFLVLRDVYISCVSVSKP